MHFDWQVVRGGDGMAGFAVRNPAGEVVKPYQWQATADYTDQVSPGGYYSVCIDNQFSRFASKLVNIYITVVKYDAWDKYAKEIEELQLNMQNFTATIGTVERNINNMLGYQAHSRHRESRDFALLLDNNSYIQTFSISQIVVILITCSIQVGVQLIDQSVVYIILWLFLFPSFRYSSCANCLTCVPTRRVAFRDSNDAIDALGGIFSAQRYCFLILFYPLFQYCIRSQARDFHPW